MSLVGIGHFTKKPRDCWRSEDQTQTLVSVPLWLGSSRCFLVYRASSLWGSSQLCTVLCWPHHHYGKHCYRADWLYSSTLRLQLQLLILWRPRASVKGTSQESVSQPASLILSISSPVYKMGTVVLASLGLSSELREVSRNVQVRLSSCRDALVIYSLSSTFLFL